MVCVWGAAALGRATGRPRAGRVVERSNRFVYRIEDSR